MEQIVTHISHKTLINDMVSARRCMERAYEAFVRDAKSITQLELHSSCNRYEETLITLKVAIRDSGEGVPCDIPRLTADALPQDKILVKHNNTGAIYKLRTHFQDIAKIINVVTGNDLAIEKSRLKEDYHLLEPSDAYLLRYPPMGENGVYDTQADY